VNDIQGVTFGQPQARVARILDFPTLANHVVGFLDIQASGTPVGGTPVCVTRESDVSWSITASNSPAASCSGAGNIGALFTQENGKRGSIVITPLARYVLPFSVSVQLQ